MALLNVTFLINKKSGAQRSSLIRPRPRSKSGAEPEIRVGLDSTAPLCSHTRPPRTRLESGGRDSCLGTATETLARSPNICEHLLICKNDLYTHLSFLRLHPSEMFDFTDNPQISSVRDLRTAPHIWCDFSPCYSAALKISALLPRPAGYICATGHSVVTVTKHSTIPMKGD